MLVSWLLTNIAVSIMCLLVSKTFPFSRIASSFQCVFRQSFVIVVNREAIISPDVLKELFKPRHDMLKSLLSNHYLSQSRVEMYFIYTLCKETSIAPPRNISG